MLFVTHFFPLEKIICSRFSGTKNYTFRYNSDSPIFVISFMYCEVASSVFFDFFIVFVDLKS